MGEILIWRKNVYNFLFCVHFLSIGGGSLIVGIIVLFLTFLFPTTLFLGNWIFIEFWFILNGMRFFVVDSWVIRFLLFSGIVCTYFVPEIGARQSTSLMIFAEVFSKNGIIVVFNSDNKLFFSIRIFFKIRRKHYMKMFYFINTIFHPI